MSLTQLNRPGCTGGSQSSAGLSAVVSCLAFQFVATTLVLGILATSSPAITAQPSARQLPVAAAILVSCVLLLAAWARWVDRLPLRLYGLGVSWKNLGYLLGGAGLGIILQKLHVIALLVTGNLAITSWIPQGASTSTSPLKMTAEVVAILLAAAVEELIGRVQPLRCILREGTQVRVDGRLLLGLVVLSFWFVFTHIPSQDFPRPFFVESLLADAFLYGVVYVVTGNIWMSLGMHAAHNLGVLRFLGPEGNPHLWYLPLTLVSRPSETTVAWLASVRAWLPALLGMILLLRYSRIRAADRSGHIVRRSSSDVCEGGACTIEGVDSR